MFLPVFIHLGAERLITHRDNHPSTLGDLDKDSLETHLQDCIEVLRHMQHVNNLARLYLQALESGDLQASSLLQ